MPNGIWLSLQVLLVILLGTTCATTDSTGNVVIDSDIPLLGDGEDGGFPFSFTVTVDEEEATVPPSVESETSEKDVEDKKEGEGEGDRYRADGTCGRHHLRANGQVTECRNGCCSAGGWCGDTPQHCTCDGCVDYRDGGNNDTPHQQQQQHHHQQHEQANHAGDGEREGGEVPELTWNPRKVRDDGRCGPAHPAPDEVGDRSECADGCCSSAGWCGDTSAHCVGHGTVDYRLSSRGGSNRGLAVYTHAHEQVLADFRSSTIFTEMDTGNAWSMIERNLPFVLFVLCECDRDANWDVREIERLIVEQQLHRSLALLYILPPSANHFRVHNTYGFDVDGLQAPQLVLDNIPKGQHIEKYRFPHDLSSAAVNTPAGLPTPLMIVQFLLDFLKVPCPLKLLLRSQPPPPQRDAMERGMVWDVVGSTSQEILYDSPFTVLLMFSNPNCPGCQINAPVLDEVAQLLAGDPSILVAKMDRTQNDVPRVVKFHKYPHIMLFRAEDKRYMHVDPLSFDDFLVGKYPVASAEAGQQCGAQYHANDIIRFVRENTPNHNGFLGMPNVEMPEQFQGQHATSQQGTSTTTSI